MASMSTKLHTTHVVVYVQILLKLCCVMLVTNLLYFYIWPPKPKKVKSNLCMFVKAFIGFKAFFFLFGFSSVYI